MKDIDICYNALSNLLKNPIEYRRIKYINDTVSIDKHNLNYLVFISIEKEYLILGFHENANQEIKTVPKMIQDNNDQGIIFTRVQWKDEESGVDFVSLDFSANYFLFADKLKNGIAYYKTNASRNPENQVTLHRTVFKEEYIIAD